MVAKSSVKNRSIIRMKHAASAAGLRPRSILNVDGKPPMWKENVRKTYY
jgi:hypothetical protein